MSSFHTLVICPDAHERHTVLYRIAGSGAAWVDLDDANPLDPGWRPDPGAHLVINELDCGRGGFQFLTHTHRFAAQPVWTFGCASALCVSPEVSRAVDCVFLSPALTRAEARYVFRRSDSAHEQALAEQHAHAATWSVYRPRCDTLTAGG